MKTDDLTVEIFKKLKESGGKLNIFIVDNDVQYRQSLKESLENEFSTYLNIYLFSTGESALAELENMKEKPQVILLDYMINKASNIHCGKHAVDQISDLCPNSSIIMIADKNYEQEALLAIEYGAHDLIIKDQFIFDHIITSVKKALHPPKQ